jgi:hypothetical protein
MTAARSGPAMAAADEGSRAVTPARSRPRDGSVPLAAAHRDGGPRMTRR